MSFILEGRDQGQDAAQYFNGKRPSGASAEGSVTHFIRHQPRHVNKQANDAIIHRSCSGAVGPSDTKSTVRFVYCSNKQTEHELPNVKSVGSA